MSDSDDSNSSTPRATHGVLPDLDLGSASTLVPPTVSTTPSRSPPLSSTTDMRSLSATSHAATGTGTNDEHPQAGADVEHPRAEAPVALQSNKDIAQPASDEGQTPVAAATAETVAEKPRSQPTYRAASRARKRGASSDDDEGFDNEKAAKFADKVSGLYAGSRQSYLSSFK